MNLKTIILVIILSVLIGFGIFFGEKMLSGKNLIGSKVTSQETESPPFSPTPTPIPLPSFEPITENSNLLEEAQKLTSPDFSEEFKSLKEEVNNLK